MQVDQSTWEETEERKLQGEQAQKQANNESKPKPKPKPADGDKPE